MKFKVCNTHFPAAWVGVEGLNLLRLDSRYYSPQYLEDDELLNSEHLGKKNIGQMAALVKDGPGGWAFKANEYTTEGVPVIRASDLVNGLDLSNAVYMTNEKHEELKQSECLPGDLVISVRGTPGRAAIIPNSVKRANLNAAVVRVRLKEKYAKSGHYIASYLNSQFGKRVTQRIANGAVQNNINLTEVRSIPVPMPEKHIREYICNKSIISDKCYESAFLLKTGAYEKLLKLWNWAEVEKKIKEVSSKKAHIVEPFQIDTRLDSEFYQPKYTCIDAWLNGKDCWILSDLIESPSKGVQPIYDSNGKIPALTVTHIDPFLIIRDGSLGFVAERWFYEVDRARIQKGEILFTVTGPPLGETVTVEYFHIPASINSHIVKFFPKKKFPYPNFITALLNSELGKDLTTRYSKGIRQKELYAIDLLSFQFPKIDKDTVILLEKAFRKSCLLRQKAADIKAETMDDIHSLIKGNFDSEAIISGKRKAPTWEDIEKELEGI